MLTKQFYITVSIGNLIETAIMGTAKFEQYIRTFVLNPTLLTVEELDLFTGTLAVQGLLGYYVYSKTDSHFFIKYGAIS